MFAWVRATPSFEWNLLIKTIKASRTHGLQSTRQQKFQWPKRLNFSSGRIMRTLNLLSKWSFQSFSIFFSGSAILRRRRNLFRSIFQWRFSSRKVRSKSKELACFTSTIFLHNKLQAISPQFRTVNFPVSPRCCCSHFFTPSNPGVECTFEVVSTAPQSGDVWLRTTFVSGQGLVFSVFVCSRYLLVNE